MREKFNIENLDLYIYSFIQKHKFISFFIILCLCASIAAPFVLELVRGENLLTQSAVYEPSTPILFGLHLFTDVAIGIAYVAITIMLGYFAYKAGRDLPFLWAFIAFAIFIVACGATHIMEAFVLWKPIYWVAGGIKWLTAIVSVGTACAVPFLIPRGLELVHIARTSKEQKKQIEKQNKELKRGNEKLQKLNKEYEEKTRLLQEKTKELETANKFMVGREVKMKELKDTIKQLKKAE